MIAKATKTRLLHFLGWRALPPWITPICGLLLISGLNSPACAAAAEPRALPQGQLPADRRMEPLKDLDGYFPFTPSSTREEWAKRAGQVQRQIQVALGLWPWPTKTPLHPVIHGRIDRDDYTVEKVYFQSLPGFFVTGNLYRPKSKAGPLPGVLCPHGHWSDGRFMDYGPERVREEIAQGAERFEEGGRSVLQARCVQLARMGCVVFHYDMIGYADSRQISHEIAHGFAKQRPEMNTNENWGLFSPQAESHLQSVMGLQTWSSIRALDFLLELPEVDSKRIAVTGASGGGTQTFLLCALDPRPTLSFPAVMVSTAMQGGCTCENASLLRVDTGNVEFAALFAPKPQGLTAANDWTREMTTKGFPELKRHYSLMGAPDNVRLTSLTHFDHNYNHVSRTAMYHWLNRHFKLGLPEPVLERDYRRLSREEMSVWDNAHPQPESGPGFERKLLRWLKDDSERQLAEAGKSPDTFRELLAPALDAVIGRTARDVGAVTWTASNTEERGTYVQSVGLIRHAAQGEELPALVLRPKQPSGQTAIWVTESGKAGLFTRNSSDQTVRLAAPVQKLLERGTTVVGLDLLYQGEFLQEGKLFTRTPKVKNPREAAAYTFGYNRSVFAQRVHDLLTAVTFARNLNPAGGRVALIGLDGTGPLVAAARLQAGDAVAKAAIHTGAFRFGQVNDLHAPDFLPGGAKYGDLPGMLVLSAPGKLWLSGESEECASLVRKAYRSGGTQGESSLRIGVADPQAVVEWLLAAE